MTKLWAKLALLFGIMPIEYAEYLDSLTFLDMLKMVGTNMSVGFFLAMFFYIMLNFCIILAVFRVIEHIADIFFSSRWLR